MIEHFYGKNFSLLGTIQHHTRHVDTRNMSPSERVVAHFVTLMTERTLHKDNSSIGAFFSYCVYDAFIAGGVHPSWIMRNYRTRHELKDDIDFLVYPHERCHHPRCHDGLCSQVENTIFCFYLKTSLRERGKQIDRDSAIAKDMLGRNARCIAIVFAEQGVKGYHKDCKNPDQIRAWERSMRTQSWKVDLWLKMSLPEQFDDIIEEICDLGERYAARV
jgi:hypothetical protein